MSDKLVKEFLTQYFTKSKLGENNARIKPYMTDSAYSEELAHQEEAINQVYKDYRLDYRFDQAKIYVNTETNEALAEVSYQVTYVSDLSDSQQKTTQMETKTLKLAYANLKGQLLVNQLTLWSGKLDDLKEQQTKEVNVAVPEMGSSTTVAN